MSFHFEDAHCANRRVSKWLFYEASTRIQWASERVLSYDSPRSKQSMKKIYRCSGTSGKWSERIFQISRLFSVFVTPYLFRTSLDSGDLDQWVTITQAWDQKESPKNFTYDFIWAIVLLVLPLVWLFITMQISFMKLVFYFNFLQSTFLKTPSFLCFL